MNFTAIDFETANYYPYSAYSLGLIKVKNNKIVKGDLFLIKPPEKWFSYYHIRVHGITYDMVKDQPKSGKLWPKISLYIGGIDFIVAHNASFDKSVLKACFKRYRIKFPDKEFKCTVKLIRDVHYRRSARLPLVCRRLKIKLIKHHNAYHDAYACARIVIKLGKNL